MRELPILFSGAMVRAILDGCKTQTRRVIKAASVPDAAANGVRASCCPYSTGQRLWVRETWAQPAAADVGATVYRADYPVCGLHEDPRVPPEETIAWKPSIHMPRARARIFLDVTDVRAEKLQDCSEADAIAEGVATPPYAGDKTFRAAPDSNPRYNSAITAYASRWDSLNAARGYGWAGNPWVWVVSFKLVA